MAIPEIAEISFRDSAGREVILEPPTPRAAFIISRKCKGIGTAYAQVDDGDLDTYAIVLQTTWKDCPRGVDLQNYIFENLAQVHIACTRYLWSLQNGGRQPPSVEDLEKLINEGTGETEGNEEEVEA